MTEPEQPLNPLLEPLTPEQADLLSFVWEPVPRADMWNHAPDWPLWDYVERSLYRKHPDLQDATEVLASLPSISRGPRGDRPYGLVWHDGHVAFTPAPGSRIGLTIAGFARLAELGRNTRQVADGLAGLIGALADADSALDPKPFEEIKTERPLAQYAAPFRTPTIDKPFVLPDRLTASVLQREYAPLSVYPVDVESGHMLQLGRASLREFRAVHNAGDYLACIATHDELETPRVFHSSPLTLIQTLDYLGYVLGADPGWPAGPRLTAAPDLQSASAFSAQVSSRHEFEGATSGLWNVIDQLHVPEIPPEVIKDRFNDKKPRSVARLDYWLERRLTEPSARSRAVEAIGVIRAVGRVRAEPQHGSPTMRRQAIEARRHLGLPDVIFDWPSAWEVIHHRLAGAFDLIREVVQSAPPRGADV